MVRNAREEDAVSIVYINTNGWKNTYKNIFPDSFLDKLDPYDKTSVEKCINKINEYLVYTNDNNEVLGFARYGLNKKGYSDNYGEVYALYVDDKYKGKKIGTKLVNYILKNMKYKYLLISTIKENSANIFYKKIGGKKISECNFTLDGKDYVENLYRFNKK